MAQVQRRGAPTLYYELDDYSDPWRNAPYLVLLHGYGRNSRFWYQWIPYLSRHYRIVRPDMRGFGRSTQGFVRTSRFDFADLAADVVAILDALQVRSAHICGEHFGGTLGMQIAADYPQRVRTLSSIAGPVILQQDTKGEFAMGEASWEAALRKHGIKKWAEATNAMSRFPPAVATQFLEWYNDELAKTDLETLIRFSSLCSSYDMTRCLARIEAPVFGIYAATRGRQVALLRQHLKRYSGIQLDTKYFMFYCVQPRLCAEAVLHFVAAYDGIACSEA
jgi:3-oxoadipate enol-lactonase